MFFGIRSRDYEILEIQLVGFSAIVYRISYVLKEIGPSQQKRGATPFRNRSRMSNNNGRNLGLRQGAREWQRLFAI